MPQYTQTGRAFALTTPLGQDALLVEAFTGSEGVSELFRFDLDLLAEADTEVPFEKVLGKPASLELRAADGGERTVHGIVSAFSQGAELRGPLGDVTFVRHKAVLVPAAWTLTRRRGCRIFQQKTVPEILDAVLGGVARRLRLTGQYERRDYCVQYRETDWAFAGRLMEEEGIFYYFDHTGDRDVLVLGDHPTAHPPLPGGDELVYDTVRGGHRPTARVLAWEKRQEVRSGRVTLWDHTFELPENNLEAVANIQSRVKAGTVTHRLTAGDAGELEVYDYPAAVAQRFDGISPGGVERDDLRQVFPDAERTAKLRMEQEASGAVEVSGEGTARQMVPGHTFALTRHFNADGRYVLTRVEHRGRLDGVYTGDPHDAAYENRFRCVPARLPFRPPPLTPRPVVHGTQSAEVVGPPGEELFTDKYGRVKVQFPWDREGKRDADSSCWVRVSQVHAGGGFGGIDIPRVGEEVVVAFEEGDPDRPIVIGRVYNAREMPPFELPGKAMVSGLRSNTYPGGGGSNEISLDDTKGSERMFIKSQFNQDTVVGNNRTASVAVDDTEKVGNNQVVTVGVSQKVDVGTDQTVSAGSNITITAGQKITLQCGAASITMMQNGMITIAGTVIAIAGMANCSMTAPITNVTGAVLLTAMGAVTRVQGGTLAQLKGGTVEVEGAPVLVKGDKVEVAASGELSAKGAPIKLN